MTYTLLIYSSRDPDQPLPPGDESAILERHRKLQAESAAKGELRAVARLGDHRQGIRVHGPADQPTGERDGAYMEAKEWLVGFYLLDCPDEATALARARSICPEGEHTIEVRPVSWAWRGDGS